MPDLVALRLEPATASSLSNHSSSPSIFAVGCGLFLDSALLPQSLLSHFASAAYSNPVPICSISSHPKYAGCRFSRLKRRVSTGRGGTFLSLSLSSDGKIIPEKSATSCLDSDDNTCASSTGVSERDDVAVENVEPRSKGAVNSSKHLWAGAVAAMVSRTFVAPLERLKLEYIVRGEQRHISELVTSIASTQGLGGFWKGNLLNILRTAPFKAINFCAYDLYRKQLRRLSPKEELKSYERFIAGAAAGITATVLCLPLDTIRTRIVAHGGEQLGGIIGAFCYMVQNEGFFSLYRGLLPSIISIAPSSAVFYGVYDILKSAYLHSPEGKKRLKKVKQQGKELNALSQLELGPIRTLLYGAIAGACAEVATYPFEVLRRQLQMQVRATKSNALFTFVNIVQQRGIGALYAGLFPSLLQVLPSASISYFVYEFMKIVLKVDQI